jgi:hypothetical protein
VSNDAYFSGNAHFSVFWPPGAYFYDVSSSMRPDNYVVGFTELFLSGPKNSGYKQVLILWNYHTQTSAGLMKLFAQDLKPRGHFISKRLYLDTQKDKQ